MIFCYRCGVELPSESAACPLCSTPVPREIEQAPELSTVTGYPAEKIHSVFSSQGDRKRRTVRGVLSLAFLSPIPPMLLTWYIQEPGWNWIWWSAAGLFYLWFIMVPAEVLYGRPLLLSGSAAAMAVALLVAIDASIPPLDWALRTAVPIAAAAAITVSIVHRASRGFSRWDLPVLAAGSLSISVAAVSIDGFINIFFGEPFFGLWLILLIASIPISAVALYLHYGAGIRVDLKKVFHT